MKQRNCVKNILLGAITALAVAHGQAQPAGSPSDSGWNTLKQGLLDSDADHRKKALAAFSTLGSVPEAVKLVEKALQDKDTLVRQRAAATLGEMGSPDAIPFLKAQLDDNSPEVSFTAAKSLWDLGDQKDAEDIFIQVIEGERKDTPGKLKGAVRQAKKKLRPGELALMGAKEAAGVFGPGSFGITAVEEVVKESKKDAGAPGRTISAQVLAQDPDPYAVTLLEWALADNSYSVRVAVCKALGDRGTQDSVGKLLPLLSDDHHAVRYMAAASIVKLNAKFAGNK